MFHEVKVSVQRSCVFAVLCLLVSSRSQWVVEDNGCKTPNGETGQCVLVRSCSPITDYLQNAPKPLSSQDISLLQSYNCGFDGFDPKVCCPDGPIIIERQNEDDGRPPIPPDVSKHKNAYLLQDESCGIVNEFNRILGGDKASLFEFPWMALLSYRIGNRRDFRCGGTLINNKYVLTAAHCLTNLGEKVLLGVRLGEHNIDTREDCEDVEGVQVCAEPVQDFGIEEIISHSEYSNTKYSNDIGLIRLNGEANMSVDNVKPICLPFSEDLRMYNFNEKNVTVTGWGTTETSRKSPELLKVQIPVIDQTYCRDTYKKDAPITYRQVCAGGKDQRDSCSGDSGGPMQVVGVVHQDARWVQVGIVSFGPRRCGLEGYPGVYTKVAYYMNWVLNNIKP